MARGEVCPAAFPSLALDSVRVPALPRAVLRPMTDILSDNLVADAITRMIESISADVIHVQTEGFAAVAARVARKLRLPMIVTLHGVNINPRHLHSAYQMGRLRPALASAKCVILVGEPLREFFGTYVGSDENFRVVPNGIETEFSKRTGPIFEDGPRRLVSVANLHEGKGIDLTLRALALLESEGISNWTYRIIGEGREKAALHKLVMDLGLAGKVTLTGAVRHVEISGYLAREDIFVLPSYREAFGIAYLEAMAAGLLAVGVMGQGPSDFIRSGENGVLVPPRDVDALVAVLREILTGNTQHWQEVAREGQRTAHNGYTWDDHARKLIAVYEQVIDGK